MSDNTNLALTADAWVKIVIERWENKIKELNIKHTGKLLDSFHHFINTQANGDPEKITFTFEFYGKFVDMGVGRGMPHGSRNQLGDSYYSKRNNLGQLHSYSRKPKPWYSKVFWSQFQKLKVIVHEKYNQKAQMAIITEIEKKNI